MDYYYNVDTFVLYIHNFNRNTIIKRSKWLENLFETKCSCLKSKQYYIDFWIHYFNTVKWKFTQTSLHSWNSITNWKNNFIWTLLVPLIGFYFAFRWCSWYAYRFFFPAVISFHMHPMGQIFIIIIWWKKIFL